MLTDEQIAKLEKAVELIAALKAIAGKGASMKAYRQSHTCVELACYEVVRESGPALLQLARAVSEAPKARAPIYALGAQIVSATVFMDEQIDAQRISGQTVALVPVPVKEG